MFELFSVIVALSVLLAVCFIIVLLARIVEKLFWWDDE